MEYIYSKVIEGTLLHKIVRLSDIEQQEGPRADLVEPDNFIQCSSLHLKEGTTFRPHKHIYKSWQGDSMIAQESWVVIRGRVRCVFYDLDDTIIAEPILEAGDASFTLHGGHTYVILEDDSIIYEYKTGPYLGQKMDKTFI